VDQLTGATSLDLLVEVAHDMRSPLGSILFLVERLRLGQAGGGPLTEAQDRQLALVYGAAFGLSAMVGDVMELARGGDRLAGGEPAPISLPEVVEGVCAIVRPLAEEKRLTLVVGEVPTQMRLGHAAALQRVLLNLVTNALKYTPEGSVAIRTETTGRGGRRVLFTIEDTGRGIPPLVLANLFQTFRRRAARDYAFSSAGLGLAICQKLIRAMGGELEVDSEPGRGTRFTFELELPAVTMAGW
jgi:signal transduction histidine kinase